MRATPKTIFGSMDPNLRRLVDVIVRIVARELRSGEAVASKGSNRKVPDLGKRELESPDHPKTPYRKCD